MSSSPSPAEGSSNSTVHNDSPYPANYALDAPRQEQWHSRGWWLLLLTVLFTALMFMANVTLDWSLIHHHDSPRFTVELSDAISALIAGVIFALLLRSYRQRRDMLRKRVEVIADMNHHVRNALQVIQFSAYSNVDQEQLAAMRDSVNRIQWALRELLPKI